jgi:hypothetical protein
VLRRKSVVLVLLALAVPATAQTFGFSIGTPAAVCLSIADVSYRIAAPGERVDHTVRIDSGDAVPDVRVALTAAVDEADFVFAEGSSTARCTGAKTVKMITAGPADLTIGFASTSTPADYRIYVRSPLLTAEAAAALYAAARLPVRRLAGATASN